MGQQKFLVKKFRVKENLSQKHFWIEKKSKVKEIFGSKKNFGSKKFLVQNIFGSNIFWVKNIWVKKKLRVKKYFGSKNVGSKRLGRVKPNQVKVRLWLSCG